MKVPALLSSKNSLVKFYPKIGQEVSTDKPLLIAGIDPGETKSYALVDIEGNLIKVNSSKHYSLESLLKEISSQGRVILVGTDVNPCPKLVRKVASALKAGLFIPQENLLVRKKQSLNNEFRKSTNQKMKNKHQKDALAIALLAWKSLNPLFNKIDLHLMQHRKQHLSPAIKEQVLINKIPIRKAITEAEANRGEIYS